VHPVSPGADGLISPSTFSGVFEINCLERVPVVAGSPTGSEWVIASPGFPSTIALIVSFSPIASTPSPETPPPVAAFSFRAPTNGNGGRPCVRHLFPSHSELVLFPHSLYIQLDLHLIADHRIPALQRPVPLQPEVLPVQFRRRREAAMHALPIHAYLLVS